MSKEILELLKISQNNPDKRKELIENDEFFLKLIKIVELICEKDMQNKENTELNAEELLKEIKALNVRKSLFERFSKVKYKKE
tara:strand:- start:221 stop:469 length:249 start_codon:yes stop_codon:yes gene_type:complete